MKPIAVILSGCGFKDGSEIHESVLTLLHLSKHKVPYQCIAPDVNQEVVIDHFSGQKDSAPRNILSESARIARGNVIPLQDANPNDYSGVIFPGGFGAAMNLCSFATKGEEGQALPLIKAFSKKIHETGKPLGFICIAPVMIPMIFEKSIQMTIGHDSDVADKVTKMGAEHIDVPSARECVVDENAKIASTPAYMLATSIEEAEEGILKLVNQVVAWTKGVQNV